MKAWLAPEWRSELQSAGLSTLEALWALPWEWFEEPNARRGGWSGISRVPLPSGHVLFVKRQENHTYRSPATAFRQRATLAREADNLRNLARHGVPVPPLVFFAQRREHGRRQAVLVTPELTGFRSLADWLTDWAAATNPGAARQRRAAARAVGAAVRRLHQAGWCHRALHPKHLFLRPALPFPEVCLIDLEKSRPALRRRFQAVKDLGQLYQRTRTVTRRDDVAFARAYRGVDRLGPADRLFFAAVIRRRSATRGALIRARTRPAG